MFPVISTNSIQYIFWCQVSGNKRTPASKQTMENVTVSDLNRMIHAIEHECALRVRELRLEATAEYNMVKSELIVKREKDLEKEFLRRSAEVKGKERREESRERQTHRMKIESLKSDMFEQMIQNVRDAVQLQSFDCSLLESILETVSIDDIVVFVEERDGTKAQRMLNKKNVEYEIRRMPVEGMGGVIVCARNGKEIWDNSFETRINIFVDRHADQIHRRVFKE